MDNQLKYGNRLLKVLSYIDDKINPEKYIQIGGEPEIIHYEKNINEENKKESEIVTVQINEKTKITFTITQK